jgi:hypothetical protein
MKKKISTYWPVAMIVPLALVSLCYLSHPASNASDAPHSHSAASVSAEFARAISFGLVQTDGNGAAATAVGSSHNAA